MIKLYELPFQVVNQYKSDKNKKHYKYVKQEFYQPSKTIKLTLLSEDKKDCLEITSDFEPNQPQDKKFIVRKSGLNSELNKQLDFIMFITYRSIFITKSGKKYASCTFTTTALKEIK